MNALITLTVLGMIAMFADVMKFRSVLLPVVLLGLITAIIFDLQLWNQDILLFNMMRIDNFAIAFSTVCFAGAMFFILFYHQFHFAEDQHYSEVIAIILFSLIGCLVLVSFTNMLMLFLGIEILSLSLYVLAGLRKKDLLSNEAALKYFLMGAFSTGFLLFGIALIYGATGSFSIIDIGYKLPMMGGTNAMIIAGVLLIMIGLLFKVAAVPFQFWTPDVYQGAPTLVTSYMATVGKIAAFASFLRLFHYCFSFEAGAYQNVLWIVAVATMLTGNIIAIYQSSMKRMLAYSSIAHAGYLLIALVPNLFLESPVPQEELTGSSSAVLFYSISYLLASMSAFVIVAIIERKKGNDDINSFNGLAKSNPLLAFTLAVSMFSLAGIPPAAGFFAKFYIFFTALVGGWVWLIVIAVISSFISVYYYFRPVIAAYMQKGNETKLEIPFATLALLLLLSLLTILLGVVPGFLSSLLL